MYGSAERKCSPYQGTCSSPADDDGRPHRAPAGTLDLSGGLYGEVFGLFQRLFVL